MSDAIPYSRAIAEHFRRPRNYGSLPNASAEAEGVNPLCGDRVRIAVVSAKEGGRTITDLNGSAKTSLNSLADWSYTTGATTAGAG